MSRNLKSLEWKTAVTVTSPLTEGLTTTAKLLTLNLQHIFLYSFERGGS